MRKLLFVCTLFLAVACSDEEKPKAPATFKTDLKTNEIDFGETLVKKQVGKEITITNSGEEDLVLKSFAISGKDAKSFTTKATKENVAGGKTYKVSLTFLPLSPGNKTADLTIVSNIGTHKITLKGNSKGLPLVIENPYDKDNVGRGNIISNNPQRTMKLAFDIDVEANSTYMIKKMTINTTGKNPNNPNDNLPFDFKIIIHKDKDGVPNEPLMETETKLEKWAELEGRLLGGQSQAFSRELSMKKPVILKADKKTKYWLEIVCISRPAIGIETRANTVMGLAYAGFNPMTKKWVVSNEQAKEDVIYKLEGEKY